jgi:hypothetical protein
MARASRCQVMPPCHSPFQRHQDIQRGAVGMSAVVQLGHVSTSGGMPVMPVVVASASGQHAGRVAESDRTAQPQRGRSGNGRMGKAGKGTFFPRAQAPQTGCIPRLRDKGSSNGASTQVFMRHCFPRPATEGGGSEILFALRGSASSALRLTRGWGRGKRRGVRPLGCLYSIQFNKRDGDQS